MELRHLRYFAAVAETRHFGRAAEGLHMAQPPLSQAIRQLDGELGTALLTRTTRQVSLTRAGEALRDDAHRILDQVESSVDRVRRIGAGRSGVLRVAFTGTGVYRELPVIARTLKRELPDVDLEVHSDLLSPDQERALVEGRVDLAVLRPPVRAETLTSRTIATEPLVLVVSADHTLAEEPAVDVADLRAEDFVMYAAAGSVVNEAVLRSCATAGFVPHRAYEAEGTAVQLALVAAGLGVALVPRSAERGALDGLVVKAVTGAEDVGLALAWRRDDDSSLLGNVLDLLLDEGLLADRLEVEVP